MVASCARTEDGCRRDSRATCQAVRSAMVIVTSCQVSPVRAWKSATAQVQARWIFVALSASQSRIRDSSLLASDTLNHISCTRGWPPLLERNTLYPETMSLCMQTGNASSMLMHRVGSQARDGRAWAVFPVALP